MGDNNIIKVSIPRVANFAKNAVMNKATTLAFSNGKQLTVINEKVSVAGSNDYLGVPALSELHFRYQGNIYVLNDCVLTVSQEKNIMQTYLQGRDSSVKEYISDGDYSISAEIGIGGDYLLSTNNQYDVSDAYPLDELSMFIKNVLKPKQALEVSSDWLDLWGIRSVVIKSDNATQETYSNRQTMTLQMWSDEPYEIKLLKNA